jgi:L-fuconolactonase
MEARRLDSHHHLWTRARVERGDYPWMPAAGPLRDDHGSGRLAPELGAAGIGGTIVVQARESVEETRFLLDRAAATEWILGVTGWAPLDRPEGVETVAELARDRHLRAVRPMLQDLPDPDWIARPQVRESLRAVAGLGLRLEVLSRAEHLPSVCDVLATTPELPAVIDHLSKPAYEWEADAAWRLWMRRAAERPNTFCKLSGMVTEVGPGWKRSDFTRHAALVFEIFGAQRVMFGSDWPVCRLVAEYPQVAGLAEELIESLAPGDADAVWRHNAERFYGVAVPG